MTAMDVLQLTLYCFVLLLLVKPLGWYMAGVYNGKAFGLSNIFGPFERLIYRCMRISPNHSMNWMQYLMAMLVLNFAGFLFTYALLRTQYYLPLNPQANSAVAPDLAFNTAASFITNTNWQAYAGETTLSYLSQMSALTVQNFLSAATGMSLLMAFIRGLTNRENQQLGNFWVDTTRGIFYILLPLSMIFGLTLVGQGVIQNFKPNVTVTLIEPVQYEQAKLNALGQPLKKADGSKQMTSKTTTTQTIPMGPVASQVAIKQLGTNGGGFFNANSAHPFENPNPLTNFMEMLAILLIPASLCYTFGLMVNDKRQGWAILATMFALFLPLTCLVVVAEHHTNPTIIALGVDEISRHHLSPGGNMEGKEARFGILDSALWASATTAASNGSVNAMLDSFTPIGGFVPLFFMHLGEVVFGGVGSGLYGMLMFVIITVFVAGLMVGRTPEYLGKKIEPFEIKMATVAILIMPLLVLVSTALASVTNAGVSAPGNPKAHGFTELLYAFTSMGNNNGSAFAGLNSNTYFFNILGGVIMLITRFWLAIPMIAIAGSLAGKKHTPSSLGTLPTHKPLFIALLISVIVIVGALSFIPALALGPIVEQLMMWRPHGY